MRAEETVRIISFRKAHEKERERFELLTGYNKANVADIKKLCS
jgi:hypothetical protein